MARMRSTMAKHLGWRNTGKITNICHWSNNGFILCKQAQRAVASKHPQRDKVAYLPSQGHAPYHFSLSAQNAALILPLAMFFAWRALNDARRFLSVSLSPLRGGDPLTPCWPKRMVFILSPFLATTTWLFVGWFGVRLGLLNPVTPARASRLSFIFSWQSLLLPQMQP